MAQHFKKTKLIAIILFSFSFLIYVSPAKALTFEELVETGKKLLGFETTPTDLNITSEIKLAEGGDVNENKEIDSGDIVTFEYTIQNPTEVSFKFATLKTNIPRKNLNFIHQVGGATGIKDNGETIDITNIRLEKESSKTISFNARVNYTEKEDLTIFSEPELLNEKKESVKKAERKEVQAKKLKSENIPSMTKSINKENKKE
jgi:hypothetical protein